MDLEEVQIQKADILELLQTLCGIHKQVLNNGDDIIELNKVRKDILICLNDLCKLNDMLITHNGQIRENLDLLVKSRAKLKEYSNLENALYVKLSLWENSDIDMSTFEDINDSEVTTIEVPCTYRRDLNQYISILGATQTGLSSGVSTSSSVSDFDNGASDNEASIQPHQLLSSITLLSLADEKIQSNIRQIEQLLKSYKKDHEFINRELKLQNNKVQEKTDLIKRKLIKIHEAKLKVLTSIGFNLPNKNESESLKQKIINFTTPNNIYRNISKEENNRLNDLVKDFIELKIDTLKQSLLENKSNSIQYLDNRDHWYKGFQIVIDLENNIKNNLEISQTVDQKTIEPMIKTAVNDLEILIEESKNETVQNLIKDEKEVLQNAFLTLINDNDTFTLNDNINNTNIHSNKKALDNSYSLTPPVLSRNKSVSSYTSSNENILVKKAGIESFELDTFKVKDKNAKND